MIASTTFLTSHCSRPVLRAAIVLLTASLACAPPPSLAGDLNFEVNKMFNDLGAVGNYTAPGAFRGQAYNTYTGGNYFYRTPNKTYQLAAVSFPSVKAGCGGIDAFGGSFSHISASEFKDALKNITTALPGIAFQVALEVVSPLLGGLSKWAQGVETMVNNMSKSSCEMATSIVSTVADKEGFSTQQSCARLAVQMGMASDIADGLKQCSSNKASILGSARTSSDPAIQAQAPFVGNLMWKALDSVTPPLDQAQKEMIISMVGTATYFPPDVNRVPALQNPTITSIGQLLYGNADAGGGNVKLTMLQCLDPTDPTCTEMTINPDYVHTPFTTLVEQRMTTIADDIRTRTPILNGSLEVGFVNNTSEPVYKMLSLGSSIPGSALAYQMIAQYRDLIAADYAYTFLDRSIRMALTSVNQDYTLDEAQQKEAKTIRENARVLLSQLAMERNSLYAKAGSINSIADSLEQLERQLRSSMPQHVMDMLGHDAALAMR
jgi:conjugative transfer pilus assembly protein TraH